MSTWHDEKLKDIKENPEKHKHDYADLQACCITPEGALDLSIMDAHGRYVDLGRNGGTKCDVTSGPCACGAWH